MFFFFNDTATTEIYTLSLHDALPIYRLLDPLALERLVHLLRQTEHVDLGPTARRARDQIEPATAQAERLEDRRRSEEHTSELQSRQYLVCRLLLEKKKHYTTTPSHHH